MLILKVLTRRKRASIALLVYIANASEIFPKMTIMAILFLDCDIDAIEIADTHFLKHWQ